MAKHVYGQGIEKYMFLVRVDKINFFGSKLEKIYIFFMVRAGKIYVFESELDKLAVFGQSWKIDVLGSELE